MSRYTVKRRLLRPLTAWRRRHASDFTGFNRAAFEANDCKPVWRRFFKFAREHPGVLHNFDLAAGATILDVGAYRGVWSTGVMKHAAARNVDAFEIHAFEPEPSAVERFQEVIGPDPRVHIYPFGLGGHSRRACLTLDGPGSSTMKGNGESTKFGFVDVDIRDVNAALESLDVHHVAVMKINIEGGEYELIDRLSECGWLPRIDTVLVQFHEFAPDAYRGRRRNRRQLAKTHSCTWSFPWVYERWDVNVSARA